MGKKYTCETCGTEFSQKSRHTTHMNQSCVVVSVSKALLPVVKVKDCLRTDSVVLLLHIPKPILKWVGGKTQIVDKLIGEFPVEINNYREIFLGGGSVLLSLLTHINHGIIKIHGHIYAYDVNEPLIYTYKNIQSRHNEVYAELQKLIIDFNSCCNDDGTYGDKVVAETAAATAAINRTPKNLKEAKMAKENYYYWIRSEYNKLTGDEKKNPIGSAMFLFLNKTCFRGVFRVGPRGFNVPYGHYANPEIIRRDHFDEIHELIRPVIFECCDFTTSINRVETNDYVYLDPPYAPETATSFVGYTENGFNGDMHAALFTLIHGMASSSNKKVMMSNADVPLVRDNFSSSAYTTTSIVCRRAINSKNPESKAKEVIIQNY